MIILDTSFLYSLLNKRDANHTAARELFDDIVNQKKSGEPVVFEYVLDELLTTLGNKLPFSYVRDVVDFIKCGTRGLPTPHVGREGRALQHTRVV